MTYLDTSPVRGRSSACSEWARRFSPRRNVQKRYWCFWIVAALFPFTLFRMVYLCNLSSMKEESPDLAAVVMEPEEGISHRHSRVASIRFPDISMLGGRSFFSHKSRLIRTDESTWTTLHERVNIENNRVKEIHGRKFVEGNDQNLMINSRGKHSSGELEMPAEVEHLRFPENNDEFDSAALLGADGQNDEYSIPEEGEREAEESEEKPEAKQSVETQDEGSLGLPENSDDIDSVALVNEKNQDDKQEKTQIGEEEKDRTEEKGENLTGEHLSGAENIAATLGEGSIREGEVNPTDEDEPSIAEEKVEENDLVTQEATDPSQGAQTEEIKPAGKCDLFDGDWVWDPEGPLYTNSTCFYMQLTQDCMGNGRSDTDYLHWKWKPRDCDLPRFDARAFLEMFKGKTIGFAGDSLARNQMQSLLCMLSQIEIPRMLYQSDDDATVRWLYEQHQFTLAVVWSPYLLKESHDGIMGFEKGQSVLYLDVLDTAWTDAMQDFDIIVLSIGQWYFKGSIYVKQDEVVGCHYCPGYNITDIDLQEAYRGAIRQVLEKVAAEFNGIAIMSTFAIAHFEGGTWDDGGQCKRERPLDNEQAAKFPGEHNAMHDVVMDEFNSIVRNKSNLNENVKLEFLDVTKISMTRADGHPGPYRKRNPYEDRNADEWVPNDCLHWCLPGPVDTWNQLLVKIVNELFTTSQNYSPQLG